MKSHFVIVALFFCVVSSSCMQLTTSKDNSKLRKSELVEIIKLDSTIKLDIRYATDNNFLGRQIYKTPKAFLQKPVAKALVAVSQRIKDDSYGLLVYDGYRPWSITKTFWDEISPDLRNFVANPKEGSIHNRGCAVDLTLYDLNTGSPLDMPCDYDAFSNTAYPNYKGGTELQRKNRDYLIQIMKKENFTVHPNEWWHFNYKDCYLYPVLDIPLEKVTSEGLSQGDKPERR